LFRKSTYDQLVGLVGISGFFDDLTVLPNPGIMVNKRNHPKMAESFRLVNYDNLPRSNQLVGYYWGSTARFIGVFIVNHQRDDIY
jgi:hypothetical protein